MRCEPHVSDVEMMGTRSGDLDDNRYHRCYNKKSGRWCLFPCKDNNTLEFIQIGLISLLGTSRV